MTIYVTGDTHGNIDIRKLNNKNFPIQSELTKSDYIIVTGDFGLVWNDDKEDMYWRKWLSEKNFTTLFIDGNHENHDLLEQYPIHNWNGGKARFITDSIIQLMRGQVYTINNKKIFTMGGAWSHDQYHRKEGRSWWPQEQPNKAEMDEAITNLIKHSWKVDYVITHTCPEHLIPYLTDYPITNSDTSTERFLEHIYKMLTLNTSFGRPNNRNYKHWYFGHWHKDNYIKTGITAVYRDIIKIE